MSIASCSWAVTYGSKCVLAARTNSGWIALGGIAGKTVAAANQAAQEGHRIVRGGRISALDSAPVFGIAFWMGKKASRNLLSRLALRYRGEKIRTSDLLNPIQAAAGRKSARASRF